MQFIPILKPVLERSVDEIIYDDIRETCETALATLKQVMGAAAEKEEISVSFKQMQVRKYGSRQIPPLPLPSVVCSHPGTFAPPPPPASGHPRAHQPPLGRGTSPPAWDGRLDAPGQRRRHLPSSAWTRRREVKQGKSGGSVGTTDQGKGKGRSVVRPMGTVAYRGKGQGKGKGRGEGRLGQGGRGRSKGGEKLMGTTAYGEKGSKGSLECISQRQDHSTNTCGARPSILSPKKSQAKLQWRTAFHQTQRGWWRIQAWCLGVACRPPGDVVTSHRG